MPQARSASRGPLAPIVRRALRVAREADFRGATANRLRTGSVIDTLARMTSGDLSGCVIVSGMPGAGKSTVTRLAARLLPRAARVGGDDVNLMIGSGFVWFMGKPTGEALRQDELCNRNMCSLANNFIDFGFTVLMDTVLVDRPELDFFLALLSPRPVRLVVLAPGIDVCRRRNAMRDPQDRFGNAWLRRLHQP
jgi:predicted kinase